MGSSWKNIQKKIKNRMPGGELYESLKQQRKLLSGEKNPFFRELMMAMYQKWRDAYFGGGV